MNLEQAAPEGKYFHIQGGPIIPGADALRAYLRTIPQKQFDAHVSRQNNVQKNDFAKWIAEVYGEKEVAKKLELCTTREQMVWVLDDALADSRIGQVLKDQEPQRIQKVNVEGQPEYADAGKLEDDAEFTRNTGEIVKRNENISAKYEEIAKNMQQALQDPFPKEFEQLTEKLRNRYADLRARITETRKSGKDCLIPSLVLRQFPGKLSLAIITREKKDFEFVKLVLDETEAELREVIGQKELNLKKEVMALAGLEPKPS